MDKYLIGETTHEIRRTICQCRKTKQIVDLGEENWTRLTLRQQRRTAMPSHIMVCVFGVNSTGEETKAKASERPGGPDPQIADAEGSNEQPEPNGAEVGEPAKPHAVEIREDAEKEDRSRVMVPAWSPKSSTNSGPKFHSPKIINSANP